MGGQGRTGKEHLGSIEDGLVKHVHKHAFVVVALTADGTHGLTKVLALDALGVLRVDGGEHHRPHIR